MYVIAYTIRYVRGTVVYGVESSTRHAVPSYANASGAGERTENRKPLGRRTSKGGGPKDDRDGTKTRAKAEAWCNATRNEVQNRNEEKHINRRREIKQY